MTIDSSLSIKFRNMSVVCAIFVIVQHYTWPINESAMAWWFEFLFNNNISRIAVPFFFMTSGFFLTQHVGEKNWWVRENCKRVQTLLMPYLSWLMISVVAYMAIDFFAMGSIANVVGKYFLNGAWIKTWGLDLSIGPTNGSLWYLRCLMIFCLFSPAAVVGVRKLGVIWLCIIFALSVSVPYLVPLFFKGFFSFGFSLSGLFWFSLGIFLAEKRTSENRCERRWLVISALVSVVILLVKAAYPTRNFMPLFHLEIIFLMYVVWCIVPTRPFWDCLTRNTFAVYVVHLIIFKLFRCFGMDAMHSIASHFACFLLMIALPFGVAEIIRTISPKAANILFAGR